MTKLKLFILTAAAVLFFAGTAWCASFPSKPFEAIAPAGPGGGWDTTIRMITKVLTEEKIITQPISVSNKPGGGGGVALSYMSDKKDPHLIAVYSPPLLLINLTGQSSRGYKNLTPIAMLINDFGAFVVSKNSPYQTVEDLFNALKKNPKSVKVGGTSSAGSMDHIQFLQAAKAAGIEDVARARITYVAFQGGEGLGALLGGHIDVYSTGMAEIVGALQEQKIRALAVTSPKRIPEGPLAHIPTLREQGIDAVFINWRGIFGIKRMPEEARVFMENALKKATETPLWKNICKQNGWTEAFMGSADFQRFLDQSNEEYKTLLKEIGYYRGR